MKEYIFESPVREVKFEKVTDKKYNVYTSESPFGYNWEIFAKLTVINSGIDDFGMLDNIQEGIIRNFFYYENSFYDENSNGFYLIYSWKNYSNTFSVQQVELSEQPFILLEDEKPNFLVLKIERVDNNDWNT